MKRVPSTNQMFGNYEDKYHATNPAAKILMTGFLNSFRMMLSQVNPEKSMTICEVGCGEGELLKIIQETCPSSMVSACDISSQQIEIAESQKENSEVEFSVQNAESLSEFNDRSFDVVVCVEVLEHLEHPEVGLTEICRISRNDILVSVPNEPIWRVLNMIRGKYWNALGNTPGHLNHWSSFGLPIFLNSQHEFEISNIAYPFPWQMVLLKRVER